MRRVAGIDVGGTFTDLLLTEADSTGVRVRLAKVPTTVRNQAEGVLAAISAAEVAPADLDLVIHGTTATTNAVLERKTARVGLITTAGFRDVLELGRRTRPKPYGLFGTFEPLIPRELRREVPERVMADGAVRTPLDEAAVADAVRALLAEGCEALVIHFLHAYANPEHELRAGAIARALWPNAYVTLGHALLSEFREYERGTTASVNAAVQPILDRYIRRLQDDLRSQGFSRDLLVMNGNGGTVPAGLVVEAAAKTVMSGPASGVMAAAATLAQSGLKNAITYDMGGTSTDVALIAGGVPEVSAELTIDYGLPIHLPMVDVHTVGAGGGSIASVNRAGMLQVGPESAGSEPGPIGYGRGGTRPTITDANLVLGRLDPARLTAVRAGVSLDTIREAFARDLAGPLGMSVEESAEAVIRLGNVHMTGAIRMVSLSRGYDPRDFVLFAFGGAGPLHAVALARELGIPEVLVPARPGLTNALGCLVADLRQDRVRTLNRPLDGLDMEDLRAVLEEQAADALAMVAEEQAEIEETTVTYGADMQFRGQTHLIRVALPSPGIDRATLQELFEAAYFRRFQVRLPEIRAVVVNLVTSVIGRRRPFPLAALLDEAHRTDLAGARLGTRPVYAGGAWHEAAIYAREALPPGAEIAGPAVIQQIDATTVVEPGATARVDAIGNLRIRV
ncbi:hydantoinase/oxoprolinase family protein [Methylobacterium frigidaeris]|uniref:Acetophenone carboxylase gamma subunit n=2 Tax=Methylobacterium frigidaeris TaxID=2038277 RepID=A0AA37M511_9HYPH|nr:hydantoinase/oxoprolinase family protein [Methylobacterium frigidaeris]GJD62096.1 Acetophenone carboxylase gamma subunit [Methylobacterium frigidaeris]